MECNQEPALVLMKKYLPEYLQNILVASGYEKLETIAKMNLPTDVDEMLKYIKESFTDLSKYVILLYYSYNYIYVYMSMNDVDVHE